jgi:hypothetical protein
MVRTVRTTAGGALALLVLLVLGLAVAGPARADDDQAGRISRMAISAELSADGGTADVVVELDLDLGREEAHGPYLVLAERQEIVGDPDHYRRLEITDITASSDTAPDDLRVERDDGAIALYVGDEDTEITGLHTYRVGYTVTGLINPEVNGADELYWNVIAPGGFELEIDRVSVRVTGPAPTTASTCYVGSTGSDTECDQRGGGADATVHDFTQDHLEPGEGLSVVLGWPTGTFRGAEPELVHRYTAGNVVQLTPLTGGIAGLATLAGVGAVAAVATRKGRDEAALGLGATAGPGGVRRGDGRRPTSPVPVRATPPDGVRPGEIGTLADEVADPHDVAATLVDLSVRGYVRIEETPPVDESGDGDQGGEVDAETAEETSDGEAGNWRLVRRRTDTAELEAYEAALLGRIFADGDAVTLNELGGGYALATAATQKDLYRTVTERGWFRDDPRKVRHRWVWWGVGVLLAGIAAVPVLMLTQVAAILAVPVVVLGIALLAAAPAMPARTAAGTAVLQEALGFREYLAAADADRLRPDPGEDLFSRYLPYAIVFGLTDRWAGAFAELADRGHHVPEPDWYVGPMVAAGLWSRPGAFSDSVGAFAQASSSAVTATSSGAGGSSGFSGSVGGGTAGMGGGSW